MENINLDKIRGKWQEWGTIGEGAKGPIAGGDDTIKSIKLVAEKVNEVIEFINSLAKEVK